MLNYLHLKPFSDYNDISGYSGIKLSINLLKAVFTSYIETREDYLQASFQRTYDEGNSGDHTHKYSNKVRAGLRPGRVFTASYTVTSLTGHINLSRLTMTKGISEIDNFVKDYKNVRQLVNAPSLKHFSSDNLSGDGGLWKKHFREDLSRDVNPYKLPATNLPLLSIDTSKIDYLTTINAMNRVAHALSEKYACRNTTHDKVVYGLDAEWNRGETGIRLLIISMPDRSGIYHYENKVRLFDFNAAGIYDDSNFPSDLRTFLQTSNFIPTGVHVGGDCSRLRDFGVHMTCWYELTSIGRQLFPNLDHHGLVHLSEEVLNATMDKSGQSGDYSDNPLPLTLQKYAAIDGVASRIISRIMRSKLNTSDTEPLVQEPRGIGPGGVFNLFLGGEVAAKVEIIRVHIHGATTKWGNKVIKKGMSEVKLLEVYCGYLHPPYSYRKDSTTHDNADWQKGNVTIGELFDENKTILLNTSSLLINIDKHDLAEACDEYSPLIHAAQKDDHNTNTTMTVSNDNVDCHCNDRPCDESPDDESPCNETNLNELWNINDDPFLQFDNEYNDIENSGKDDVDIIYGRCKTDIFHEYKNLPIGKNEPRRSIIFRLLIHATFEFDVDDFQRIESFLQREKKWNKLDDTYLDKVMVHFYHNREWWREHCRMYVVKALEHAHRMQLVIDVIKNDESLKDLMNDELEKYFEGFVRSIFKGEFEEVKDVAIFIKIKEDMHGLPVYRRLRGTVRTENVHQKMETAIGPWGVGARTAHALLLLISYRYNANTTTTRCNGYEFGHYELHYIDRIQQRVQELFNVIIFPRHKNVTQFKGNKDFVSVGIGPLSYDPNYVELSSNPSINLKQDLHFIAKRMGLKYPLLPLASTQEVKVLNDFLLNHSPTTSNLEKLARQFKELSDGVEIFPKLPSMLKAYATKKWEKNHAIRTAHDRMGDGVKSLLKHLFSTQTDGNVMYPNLTRLPMIGMSNTHATNDVNIEAGSEEEFNVQETILLHVPPLQAPFQNHVVLDTIMQKNRRCACYPSCKKQANECGGWRRTLCRYTPAQTLQNNDKVAAMDAAKREYYAERRRMKRNQTTK